MQCLQVVLWAFPAWFLACLFTAIPPRAAAVNGAIAGVFSSALAFFLALGGVSFDWTPVLFLLFALVLPIQHRQTWEERFQALLPALGGYGLLALLGRLSVSQFPPWGAVLAQVLTAVVFCLAGYGVRSHFPPSDWSVYTKDVRSSDAMVHPWHIWSILGVPALLELGLLYVMPCPDSGSFAAVFAVTAIALYWGALYAACLAAAYHRTRLTTLIDQNYRAEMQTFMNVIRSQRHDYNFHVQALSGLIEDGDLEACRQYIRNLRKDSIAMNTVLPIKDPAIAALIHSFRTTALEDGIELHLDIQNDLSCVVTSVYETNKVIGNLLQNAIDEVRTHKDKSFGIHLYILKRGENCIIHVANKVSLKEEEAQAYLQEMYRPGHSTKANHEGIGLSSIQNLLQRYRGVVYSRLDGEVLHCVAKIPLRLEGGNEP